MTSDEQRAAFEVAISRELNRLATASNIDPSAKAWAWWAWQARTNEPIAHVLTLLNAILDKYPHITEVYELTESVRALAANPQQSNEKEQT